MELEAPVVLSRFQVQLLLQSPLPQKSISIVHAKLKSLTVGEKSYSFQMPLTVFSLGYIYSRKKNIILAPFLNQFPLTSINVKQFQCSIIF